MIPTFTIVIALCFVLFKGLGVTGLLLPVIATAGLLLVGRAYKYRAPNFTLCLTSLAALVSFSTAFALAMDAAVPVGGKLWDSVLLNCDAALGLNAAATQAWFKSHATLQKIMSIAYFSAIPQTIVAIVFFGLSNNLRLKTFLQRYMASAIAVLIIFAMFPARGSYVDVPGSMNACRDRFDTLYAGALSVLDPSHAQGIITFPSFHTVWGVLLVVLFWKSAFRVPVLVLNVLMILSTIPVGCHYFTDILGGLVVAAVACLFGASHVRDSVCTTGGFGGSAARSTSRPPRGLAGGARVRV